MNDEHAEAARGGDVHRMFLMYEDSTFAPEAASALRAGLPAGWALADEPDDATAILAVGLPVDADVIKRAGESLRVVGATETETEILAGLHPDVRVVTLPGES